MNEKTQPSSPSKAEIEALEQRVHLIELRAREAEGELRLIRAQGERRDLKTEKRKKMRGGRKGRGKKAGGEEE